MEISLRDMQEKINILSQEQAEFQEAKKSLQYKIGRYNNLKNIIERISKHLSLEAIADNLVLSAFNLVANSRGTCILYLLEEQGQSAVKLYKSKKENPRMVIKAKEGDVFDHWVMRHAQPLLVEDAKKDFRFDLEKVDSRELRQIRSLISVPLLSHNRFIGILRLDCPQENIFGQDDLRLLMTLSDFGAVSLENGELFQSTQELAIRDALTGLYTKGYFSERLKEEYKRSVRQNKVFSLLMLDIDNFKRYNDTFGHTAGDIVLKTLGSIIKQVAGESNAIISRFGGEEFCLILPDLDNESSGIFAEKLRQAIASAKIILRRQESSVTVSVGVSTLTSDVKEENELFSRADQAMYKAKKKGKNRVERI